MNNFYLKVYELCKQIPKGKVSTYKEIARKLNTKAYRAVGTALNRNPNLIEIPCHRVIKSNGDVGYYKTGTNNKIKLLKQENIEIKNNKIDLQKYLYQFK